MKGLRVLRSGPLSLLQDAGRFGWQHLGVSPSGPLDMQAAAWANRLLGNRWGTPLLEIALGDFEVEAEVDTWLAICGADMPVRVDGEARPNWSRFALRSGQRLRLDFARSGQRAYLAVAGGFRLEKTLGSVATQVREGLGGLGGNGGALQAGDRLPCPPARLPGAASVPAAFVADYRSEPCLRVMLDSSDLAARERQRFVDQRWALSPQSDRMGARLCGEPLRAEALQWSQGVVGGSIQVPPDGQPIVLMADRQTMGGYPLLGWLHPLDLPRLAQCPAHQRLGFRPVERAQVQAELRQFYRFFRG
ncbi:biotin-dependent carboxyltransferase family protein [Pseudomonas sp.]|uniref:5-oxoprolinase subunit C family protein n=1 Tax=Pseudomonas sp. TaxID=306 RepID=UPI003D0D57AA